MTRKTPEETGLSVNSVIEKRKLNWLMLMAVLLTVLMFCSGLKAANLLSVFSVQPEATKSFIYLDNRADVTDRVPPHMLGAYVLPEQDLKNRRYARTLELKPGGKGVLYEFGLKKKPVQFEWGLLVKQGQLFLTRYRSEMAGVLVIRWHDGKYSHNMLHEHEGRLALYGPKGTRMVLADR